MPRIYACSDRRAYLLIVAASSRRLLVSPPRSLSCVSADLSDPEAPRGFKLPSAVNADPGRPNVPSARPTVNVRALG
eukprot:373762-Rhodomonas_salina.5